MWEGRAQSRRKRGRGESSPGANVGRGLGPPGVCCARDCAGHCAVRHAACDCSRHVRQLLQEYEMVGTEDCFLWVGLECSEFKFSELVDILIRCVHMQQCCNSTTGLQPCNHFRAGIPQRLRIRRFLEPPRPKVRRRAKRCRCRCPDLATRNGARCLPFCGPIPAQMWGSAFVQL